MGKSEFGGWKSERKTEPREVMGFGQLRKDSGGRTEPRIIHSDFRPPTSPFQSLWTLSDQRSYNPAPFRRQTLPQVCLSIFHS